MFQNRQDAAQQLARRLAELKLDDPIVFAIPCGGVVTGAVLARELGAELDVVLAHKLRAPFQPELAIGAVGEDGSAYINRPLAAAAGADEAYLTRERFRQQQAIRVRRTALRGDQSGASAAGRSVILTDDGVATGSTMIAALHVVAMQAPAHVVVATPVAPADRVEVLRTHCDRLICLVKAADFQAVGQFYRSFEPVDEREAARLLHEYQAHHGRNAGVK